jgi:iron complex transport system substrate-binding protein
MKGKLRKLGAISLVAALFLGLLVSCTTTPESASPATPVITDQLGRTVTLATTTPQRIVSLAPSHTEILYALGLGDRVVARTDYCNYPPEAKEKPSIGGFSTPNIEEVVAMDPDLVLAMEIHEDKVIPQLESKGLIVVALNPKTIDEVMESITLIGKVTGAEKEAVTLVAEMQSRIKAVTDKTSGLALEEKPKTFYVVWFGDEGLMVAGSGTLQNELIAMAGGRNIGIEVSDYANIDIETAIVMNPAVIIVDSGHGSGGDQTFQYIITEARLKDTDAIRKNQAYPIDSDLATRPGPRIVEGLELFARFIHPELFK